MSLTIPTPSNPFSKSFCKDASEKNSGEHEATLSGLTTEEEHHTETKRVTDPIDLTSSKLEEIGLDSPVALLQRGVVRLRVIEVPHGKRYDDKEVKTLGSGSGITISADGAILSVNHVPALGQQSGAAPFDMLAGTNVLKNLKSWKELLGQKGDVRLVADIPLLPQPKPPSTIFTPGDDVGQTIDLGKIVSEAVSEVFSGGSKGATEYSRLSDTIEYLTVPLKIVSESPSEDLMLAIIDLKEAKDPYPFVPVTDSIPTDFVYSIGHPLGIRHNALALGEVLDPSFDVAKIEQAIRAHGVILGGIGNAIGRGNGISSKNFSEAAATALSMKFIGIDVETLKTFLQGAVISTNRIDHGSSGGLLCNESGEAVGITYLGVPLPDSRILRYAAGVLGFHTKKLPLSAVTGSVGMEKAIPFLQARGVDIVKAREGEPIGVEQVANRAARQEARKAMKAFLIGSGMTDSDIEGKLEQVGLGGKDEPITVSGVTRKKERIVFSGITGEERRILASGVAKEEAGPRYFVKGIEKDIDLKSEPVEVMKFEARLDDSDKSLLVLDLDIRTTDGETAHVKDLKIDPRSFNPEISCDPKTKEVLLNYLMANGDKLAELSRLQKETSINRDSVI